MKHYCFLPCNAYKTIDEIHLIKTCNIDKISLKLNMISLSSNINERSIHVYSYFIQPKLK